MTKRTIIRPPQGIGLPPVREIWAAREVFWRFGTRDIVLRYRQTVVGIAWVIIQPLLAVLLVVFGVAPGWGLALLPVWIIAGLMIALGIGLAASAMMVKYRDVGYVLPWVMQVAFFATPVAYSLEAVPDNLMWLFQLNPLTWLMEAFRWSLLDLYMPPLWQMFGIVGVGALVLAGGTLVFQNGAGPHLVQ